VEANEICEEVGGRLCTLEEHELGCASFSGCGHDGDLIWTNTIYNATEDTGSPDTHHIIACGSSVEACSGQSQTEENNSKHEVRCCADWAVPGWEKRFDCPVWGESNIGGNCYHDNTWDEAHLICKAHGGRLCTKEELLADCTRNTGCSHDRDMIWSSSVP